MTTTFTIDAGALTSASGAQGPRVFLLIHVQGAERSSRIVELPDGAEVTFGRSRSATVMVDHDSVSRLHARIRRRGDAIDVEDLGSRNGTRVDGAKISEATALSRGGEVTVGPVTAILGASSALVPRGRVADAEAFEVRLAAELDRVVRYHRRAAVVAMKVSGDEDVVDALATLVRPMDLLAELGGNQFALLAPELGRSEIETAMQRFIEEAKAVGTDVRVGIAMAPEDGITADSLLEASRAALRRVRVPSSLMHAPPVTPTETSDLVVSDPAMKHLYATVERIAEASLTVLIFGETGVGKELVTEALHRSSPRRDKPLVKLNCASLPESLLESELFGYERGAFTGADRRKVGFFEAADGGLLFLDEIGEMPLTLQAKLLRVLERKTITRVGGTQEISVDVRVVAATHRDLDAEVRAGRFREDLFFRIAGFTVFVPPLRDRKAELLPLAEYFVRKVAAESGIAPPSIDDAARAALLRHDWPGNVRELKNAMERAIVMQNSGVIGIEHLPERLRAAAPVSAPLGGDGKIRQQLAEIERTAIVEALEATGGNQTHAAQRLGISRRTLIYKMEKFGLKAPPKSAEHLPSA
ncbi:MAG: sigma 54-interacting transcriptional regulator [Myxococcales bacterium]|nr:sigma 54-interacting transcriptional regulator [Myxococcales bacterium]